jgi:nitrogen regulatory protein PII
MKMVTPMVRITSPERIVRSLESLDVRGMTISGVKGVGDSEE